MMRKQKQMILSLTDSLRLVNQATSLLFLAAVLFGCAAFFYAVLKPVHFTATGIFNGHVTQTSAPLVKALEFLSKEESSFSPSDQRFLIYSYPVLENVVRTLSLQATLTEKKRGGRLCEIWYTLKAAKALPRLKKQKPPSRILSSSAYAPSKLIIPDEEPSFCCSDVEYVSETALSLNILFLDASTFRVFGPKKELGIGYLNAPFIWQGGSFTLSGSGKKGKKLGLHLIPLEPAVESLKKTLKVVKSKENSALIEIRYAHRDRKFAAQIVNEVMEQFQDYLMQEGKKKIKKQLLYLQQRQEEVLEQLDGVLHKQKKNLESDIASGTIVTLEKELEFMAKQQSEKREELLRLGSEMQALSLLVNQVPLTLNQLFEILSSSKEDSSQALSLESTHHLILQHQQQLDLNHLDNERYDFCLAKLLEPDFDSSSLSKTLNEDFLRSRFEKIHTLHHHLVDSKNWTGKERERLKEELETEKRFLDQHIRHLKEGVQLQEKIVKERILTLKRDLLYLLFQRYKQTEEALSALSQEAAHFPQKWLNEQKIEIHSKLYTDMIESIGKMVEAKNIGYNIDYLMSNVLQNASVPVIPDDPRLVRAILLGGGIGLLLVLFGLFLYQAWVGPSASFENLSAQGKWVAPKRECIQHLGLKIVKAGKSALILSKQKVSFVHALTSWLAKRGETVFTLDLTSEVLPEFMQGRDREAYLCSDDFKTHLSSLQKSYDRVVIVSKGSSASFEAEILAASVDTVAYCITDERLKEIETLSENTLFVIENEPFTKLELSAIEPKLTQLIKNLSEKKSSSFSSLKSVLKLFPLKKT